MKHNTYYRRYNTAVENSTVVNYFDPLHLNRWDFFYRTYVAWHTKKIWAFSDLVEAISTALHENFVRSKYANSVSQFLLYWMQIICCIYKGSFDNWRRFCRPFAIYVPVKCPQGGGIWSPERTLVWGIWMGTLAWVGGDLNNNFQKSQMPGGLPGGMLKLRFDRYITSNYKASPIDFETQRSLRR